MKLNKSLLFIILVCVFLSCGKKETTYKVFILAGQSNMVGMGQVKDLDESISQLPGRFLYYRQCDPDIRKERTNFMDSLNTFGPEVTFSHTIKEAFPNDSAIIIKCALGGVSLYNGFYPAGSNKDRAAEVLAGENRYDWFSKLISLVNLATKGRSCSFEGVFWMQGERDCRFEKSANEYEANLIYLVDSLRANLQSPEMLFIIGRVDPPKDERYQYQNLVRKSHEELTRTSPPAAWIDCDNLGKHTDDLHNNTQGQLELGKLFADKYLEMYDKGDL